MLGCNFADNGDDFSFKYVFSGFSNNTGQLLIVRVINLISVIVIIICFAATLIISLGGIQTFMGIDQSLIDSCVNGGVIGLSFQASEYLLHLLIAEMTSLALYVPLLMLLWFASALVVMRNEKVVSVLQGSLSSSLGDSHRPDKIVLLQ